MGARTKLNASALNGALVVAALAGILCQSWTVFLVALAALVVSALLGGDIRPTPRPR